MSPAGRSRTVAEALAAFEAGGPEGLLPYLTEDVVWADDPDWPDAQVSHGREAVQAIIEERLDTTSIQPELEGMEERGDRVLAWFRWKAVGEASGATAVLLPAVLFDFSGDLIARVRFFLDREHAWAEFGGRRA
jgi:ketosteroid isomerase-like protein